ncbi:DUF3667 domain-containing protein [Maribacter polysiphoniae]|uniref:DUF3667 domain-containing protein n=1 Tax=Maribacter polysiphoniae TaxID=429344 RepID=UPI002357930B|nr:DUF3667 domain-containing protein [Maribacter polysiphoniae]
MKCLNCDHTIEEKFCPKCGQKTSTHRFSLQYIFDYGLLSGIFSINKGLLFTIKELFTRPGHGVRAYMEGKRIIYFNAFSLLLLLITLAYFIDEYSGLRMADIMSEDSKDFANDFEQFTKAYPRLIYFLNIPIMALATFLWFRKSTYNFAENIILNTYNSAAQVILSVPFMLVTLFYDDKEVLTIVFQLFTLIPIVYSIWIYYQFFSKSSYKKTSLFFRSLFSVVTFILIQSIITWGIVSLRSNV